MKQPYNLTELIKLISDAEDRETLLQISDVVADYIDSYSLSERLTIGNMIKRRMNNLEI